ncbi:hypothetical protein PISMIDRAFT_689004 [Pisolithus microcarpus 441]|uniref:Uncharacterized protein n=1 Tax=Pisolithus microcarpus 441 TaxID=765257 RepID=A0A0C9XLA2_9AGAM|nr:hypothetical protein PISMIDRAFT_689004 [Pisolithus microcarpus 441]
MTKDPSEWYQPHFRSMEDNYAVFASTTTATRVSLLACSARLVVEGTIHDLCHRYSHNPSLPIGMGYEQFDCSRNPSFPLVALYQDCSMALTSHSPGLEN